MDRITIWLADENEHYVELLKRYIRTSHFKNKLIIAAYSDASCFEHALEHVHSEAIVLVSGIFLPICSKLPKGSVFLLSEEINRESPNASNCVYKYRPLNQLLDQVLNMYYESKSDVKLDDHGSYNELKVISVYSASGGSGVTTIALQLSEFYASLGKKVFYLNLEPIHSMISSATEAVVSRFTQVLYSIKSGQPLQGKFQQLLRTDHLGHYEMFHPTRYSREWSEYERADMQLLLQALERTGRYDLIVIDVGNQLTSASIGALEHSDETFWVIPDRASALAKVEYIRGELRKISGQLYDRIHTHSQYVLQLNSMTRIIEFNPSFSVNTILPYVPEWQHCSDGAPPATYRQALLRLIGMNMDERLDENGANTRESIHRPA